MSRRRVLRRLVWSTLVSSGLSSQMRRVCTVIWSNRAPTLHPSEIILDPPLSGSGQDRPEQTVYTQIRRRVTRRLIWVYFVCPSSRILDISTDSKMDLLKVYDKYGTEYFG